MNKRDDLGGLWLHLICCGGPLVLFVLIGLAPTLIAFALTYKAWLLAAGLGTALAGGLVGWRRARRVARPSGSPKRVAADDARQR